MSILSRLLNRQPQKASITVVEPPEPQVDEAEKRGDDPFAHLIGDRVVPAGMAYPAREGYAMLDGASVLVAHEEQVRMAYRSFDARSLMENFDKHFYDLMHSFSKFVGLLPASQRYHHAKPGGLFAHSVDVATKSLHYASGHIMNSDSAPRDRESDRFAWAVAAFICGLLHDIGKVQTIGRVVAASVQRDSASGFVSSAAPNRRYVWRPEVCSLDDWLRTYKVDKVHIEFDEKHVGAHDYLVQQYFFRIVPLAFRSLIFNSNPRISSMVAEYIRAPYSPLRDPLHELVQKADHQSVRFDRDPRGLPGAIDLNTLIIRRFLEYAAEQKFWNVPSAQFHHAHISLRQGKKVRFLELDFWVPTNKHVESFIHYFRSGDTFGMRIPDNTDEVVFEALISNGVISPEIPGVLDAQEPVGGLPFYNPATLACVRFTSTLRPGANGAPTVHPISHEPMLVDLPVVALSRSPVPGHRDNMPVLSFEGEPGFPTTSLPVRIENDELMPADEMQDNDPIARKEIEEATGLAIDVDDPEQAQLARSLVRMRSATRARKKAVKALRDRSHEYGPGTSVQGTPHDENGVVQEDSESSVSDEDQVRSEAVTAQRSKPGPKAGAKYNTKAKRKANRKSAAQSDRSATENKTGQAMDGNGQVSDVASCAYDDDDDAPLPPLRDNDDEFSEVHLETDEYFEPHSGHHAVPVWKRLILEEWTLDDKPLFLAIAWLHYNDQATPLHEVKPPSSEHGYLISDTFFTSDGRKQFGDVFNKLDRFADFAKAWPGNGNNKGYFRNFIEDSIPGFLSLRKPVASAIIEAMKEDK